MAVAYDSQKGIHSFGATTLTTGSFTIAGTNTAAFLSTLFLAAPGATVSGPACGGVTGTALASAVVTLGGYSLKGYQVIGPATGSQTASMTWTNSVDSSIIVLTANGVDQTTCMNGGMSAAWTFGTSVGGSITSTSGDLTTSVCGNDNNKQFTTNQTIAGSCAGNFSEQNDYGAGTGTATHTWSFGTSQTVGMIGGNFIQVSATNPLPSVNDPITVSENTAPVLLPFLTGTSVNDGVTLDDSPIARIPYLPAMANDTVTVTDSTPVYMLLPASANDSVSVADDGVTARIPYLPAAANDSVTVTDDGVTVLLVSAGVLAMSVFDDLTVADGGIVGSLTIGGGDTTPATQRRHKGYNMFPWEMLS